MGTGRSGPFHSAAGGGVRGGSCTHPQSRPRPWPVSQRGCRQVAGAQDREAGFRVRSSRWRWLVPSHGCSSQRSRSPPLPSPPQRVRSWPNVLGASALPAGVAAAPAAPRAAPSLDSPPPDVCDPSRPRRAQRAASLSPPSSMAQPNQEAGR